MYADDTTLLASGVATGEARGRVPPLTAKKLRGGKKGKIRKIGRKEEKSGNKGKNRKGFTLCPSWQIGLATLLLLASSSDPVIYKLSLREI